MILAIFFGLDLYLILGLFALIAVATIGVGVAVIFGILTAIKGGSDRQEPDSRDGTSHSAPQ